MAELYYNEAKGEWAFRQELRSPFIDYYHGWFFVTIQIAKNKSILGAVVGEECVLNELGEAVKEAWLCEPKHAPGLQLFDFQVMPNHFHALLYYKSPKVSDASDTQTTEIALGTVAEGLRATKPEACGLLHRVAPKYERDPNARDLPYVIGLFKSWTTKLYHRLKAAGRCIDIGPKLWQESFYDELVRSEDQFNKTAAYIRNNPANWNLDRFGEVTTYAEGNLDLLQSDYTAYLSSEGYSEAAKPGEIPARRIAPGAVAGGPQAAPCRSQPTTPCRSQPTTPCRSRATAPCRSRATAPETCVTPREAPVARPPVISTFTSYYERQMLERCLRSGRRFIWVCPGGISPTIQAKASEALTSGRALLISPVAPLTGVNKQRANWCNQFIAKNANEIWAGHIRPGGSLESILKGCRKGTDL